MNARRRTVNVCLAQGFVKFDPLGTISRQALRFVDHSGRLEASERPQDAGPVTSCPCVSGGEPL